MCLAKLELNLSKYKFWPEPNLRRILQWKLEPPRLLIHLNPNPLRPKKKYFTLDHFNIYPLLTYIYFLKSQLYPYVVRYPNFFYFHISMDNLQASQTTIAANCQNSNDSCKSSDKVTKPPTVDSSNGIGWPQTSDDG